jgi:hypothetical protein
MPDTKAYKTSKSEKKEKTESGPAEIRTQGLLHVNVSYDYENEFINLYV